MRVSIGEVTRTWYRLRTSRQKLGVTLIYRTAHLARRDHTPG
jgi:hypothetical protein